MEIDNLSVTLKTNGADDAIRRIWDMAASVDALAKGVSRIDASTLKAFAEGMAEIKKAAPTENQASNMKAFTDAVSNMCAVIGSANTAQFATDLSNISDAAKGGTRTATAWQKAASSMNSYSQAAQQAANASNNVSANSTPPMPKASYQDLAMQFKTAYGELSKVYDVSKTIGGSLVKMGALVPTSKFKALEERAAGVKEKYDELRATIARGLETGQLTEGSKEYEKMTRELQALNNEYDQLILKQKELALSGGGFTINPTLQKGLDSFKSGFTGVINLVKNGLGGAFKAASGHVSSFVKQLRSANLAQKAFKKTMDSLKSMPSKFIKELTRIGKMLKLMVTRMALRAVIKEVGNGFKSLAIHSDEFNQSVSDVMNASKQLGYSFAAMVSPLINALAPAIVYVINLLTQLLNAINQVFSALTGAGTWNRAKKFTDSWRDSIGGAGKAAKELKKTVLGFDELNQLQDNKNKGGGGNNIADMFETVPIDQKWKDFADWLKEMWKNKDFYDLGKMIGEKLRDVLESIPWDKIRKTSNDLGKCLATLLNGFVEVERLGFDIGYTLAQAVNTVFEFVNGFVHNLHWDSVGKFIADVFNGFFETIDWKLIKDTVVTGLKGIADAIQSFINNFHWDNISNFIINAVDTVVSGIKAFIDNIDWGDLGAKLSDQLMKTIRGIDWRAVGEAIGSIIQAAVDFVANFVNNLNVDDIRKALKNLVDGFFDKVDTEELGRTLANIIDVVIQVAAGFWRDNKDRLWEEGKKLVKGLFEGLDSETKGDIAKIIAAVISAAVLAGLAKATATIFASSLVTGFKNMLVSALFGSAGSSAGGAAAGGAVTSAGTSFGLSIAGAILGGIALGLGGSDLLKKAVFGITEAVGYHTEEVGNLKEAYKGFGGTLEIFKEGLQEVWYRITGNKEALEELNNKTFTLRNETGEATKVVDRFGNTVIDFSSGIKDMAKSTEDYSKAAMNVHTTMDQQYDDVINIIPKTKEYSTGLYTASTAEESLNMALSDLKTSLNGHKSTLDVINEATSKNVEKAKEQRDATNNVKESFTQLTDVAGKTTLVIKDNKDAYIKASEATKKATDETQKYIGVSKDDITIVTENTRVIKDNNESYIKASEAVKDSTAKLTDYEGATKDVITIIPTLNKETETISTTMQDVSKSVTDSTEEMRANFTEDKWTLKGVKDGLTKSFTDALDGVKSAFRGFFDWINDKLNMEVKGEKVNIGRVGYATGGFPEDGIFFANHSELVGKFSNGKTAVANNAQIVEGIQNGVYNGVRNAMGSQSSGASYISNEIIVDGDVIARTITKAQEKQNRRYSPLTV